MEEQTERPNLKVLLVDDDKDHAQHVGESLGKYSEASFTVVWKKAISEAQSELQRNASYDIILTDYEFPSSNGLDFCLELNARDIHIPIVFLTAVKDFTLAVEAMKLGVEDFLIKDELSEMNLGRSLENIVSRARTRDGLTAVARRMKLAESRSEATKELVVTVCHEFNNPLASIKISADLLKRLLPDPEDAKLLATFEDSFAVVEREIVRLRDTNFERIDPHVSALKEGPQRR